MFRKKAEKTLSDYLPLYMGVRMLVGQRSVAILTPSLTNASCISLKDALANKAYKPLLHRLEDITPELRRLITGSKKGFLHHISWTPEMVKRMQDEHYDLYDLIQWDLALDAKLYKFSGSSERHDLSALKVDDIIQNGMSVDEVKVMENEENWEAVYREFKGTRQYQITPAFAIDAAYKHFLIENYKAPQKFNNQ